jgi:hypothetical protein
MSLWDYVNGDMLFRYPPPYPKQFTALFDQQSR